MMIGKVGIQFKHKWAASSASVFKVFLSDYSAPIGSVSVTDQKEDVYLNLDLQFRT